MKLRPVAAFLLVVVALAALSPINRAFAAPDPVIVDALPYTSTSVIGSDAVHVTDTEIKGHYDYYRIRLEQGHYYQFSSHSLSDTSVMYRALVEVRKLDGTPVATPQSTGPDDAMECFTPEVTGDYLVGSGSGAYYGTDLPYRFDAKEVQVGRIEGRVTGTSGEPVSPAIVRLGFVTDGIPSVVDLQTDQDGRFKTEPLPVGNWEAETSADLVGYIGAQTDGIVVEAGKVTQLAVSLQKGASISGYVTGANGLALHEYAVRAFRVVGPNYIICSTGYGEAQGPDVAGSYLARRLAGGQFAFQGLPAGRYVVSFILENWDPATGELLGIDEYHLYDGTLQGSKLNHLLVDVSAGAEVTGIDGQMSTAQGAPQTVEVSGPWVAVRPDQHPRMLVRGYLFDVAPTLFPMPGYNVLMERSFDNGATWEPVGEARVHGFELPELYSGWEFDYTPALDYQRPHLLRARFAGVAGKLAPAVGETVTYGYTAPRRTLRYSAGTGGTIVGQATQSLLRPSDATAVTATPLAGYRFVEWSDHNTNATRLDGEGSGDLSVSARFVRVYATKLTLSGTTRPRAGRSYKLKGAFSATGARGTVKVRLWRKVGTKWKPAGSKSLYASSGKFAYTFKPKYRGSWKATVTYTGASTSSSVYRPCSATKTFKVK
ncbi:MAG TPA: carboxypeptidase regulatory-like domain-containing protein [Coriobacteriia bacterium]|nr:carboxypeptidase regulatory-like domain-containing protein [Coriobacteriia bacterium]